MPINKNSVIISLSDRPLGTFRMLPDAAGSVCVSIVPLEFVRENLGLLIGENRTYQKEMGTGKIAGYIQDACAALDIIEHALFLYVETSLPYTVFLEEYAVIPDDCPVCLESIDFLDAGERLDHIIRCRRNSARGIIAAATKSIEHPKFLH